MGPDRPPANAAGLTTSHNPQIQQVGSVAGLFKQKLAHRSIRVGYVA